MKQTPEEIYSLCSKQAHEELLNNEEALITIPFRAAELYRQAMFQPSIPSEQEIEAAIRFGIQKGVELEKSNRKKRKGKKEGTILSVEAYGDNCIDRYKNMPDIGYCQHSGCMNRAIIEASFKNKFCDMHYEKYVESQMD